MFLLASRLGDHVLFVVTAGDATLQRWNVENEIQLFSVLVAFAGHSAFIYKPGGQQRFFVKLDVVFSGGVKPNQYVILLQLQTLLGKCL